MKRYGWVPLLIVAALVWVGIINKKMSEPATDLQAIRNALDQWQPVAVKEHGDDVVVVLRARSVEEEAYVSVITGGLCMTQLTDPEILDGIAEIAVLNRFEGQGYIYTGGRTGCKELNEMPLNSKEWRIKFLSMTRVYMGNV